MNMSMSLRFGGEEETAMEHSNESSDRKKVNGRRKSSIFYARIAKNLKNDIIDLLLIILIVCSSKTGIGQMGPSLTDVHSF